MQISNFINYLQQQNSNPPSIIIATSDAVYRPVGFPVELLFHQHPTRHLVCVQPSLAKLRILSQSYDWRHFIDVWLRHWLRQLEFAHTWARFVWCHTFERLASSQLDLKISNPITGLCALWFLSDFAIQYSCVLWLELKDLSCVKGFTSFLWVLDTVHYSFQSAHVSPQVLHFWLELFQRTSPCKRIERTLLEASWDSKISLKQVFLLVIRWNGYVLLILHLFRFLM